MAVIEFHTLGKIDLAGVEEDAVEAVLRGPKRLGLLAYLALARPGEHVRRDTLLALLWPEHDATRARHALRNTLYSLRRALGREVLRGRGKQDLAVSRKQLWCDAVAFREALAEGRREDALLLYRGELLPGMYVDGAGVAFE
ncbi:MAG: AfsR/SARP family transcriptional regulator, partial [Gemmatimonadota bacterium]